MNPAHAFEAHSPHRPPPRFSIRSAAWLTVVLLSAGLAACDDDDPPAQPLSGTAAVGQPIAGGNVAVRCTAGVALSTTTSASGTWNVNLAGETLPCMVSVTGGSPSQSIHAIAQATGNLDVTSVTELILASAAGMAPSAWLAAHSADFATALPTLVSKLPAAQAAVRANLVAAGYTVPAGDLMTVQFNARAGDAYDDLLTAIRISLADAGLTFEQQVAITATAGTGTLTLPFTTVQTAVQLSAMPQLNSATLSVTAGVLSMKTLATPAGNAVGAYVGGGNGNKAVLQLPGLAGMKLKDFQQMSIELKSVSAMPTGAGNDPPYASVNMMIDLDCNSAPLSATATVADARARHRLLTFDPFYKFIQAEPGSISTTEFKTITFTPATGGWRMSGGAVNGDNDTGVEETNHGVQYSLQSFDYVAHPNACIVDGVSADGGMARDTSVVACNTGAGLPGDALASCGKAHSGVFIFVGNSGMLLPGEWQVRKASVNKHTYTFQ